MPTNGPVRVSPNGRYFVNTAGQPWLWLGDTAWPLCTQYPLADAEAYLANRAAKGFTVIQSVLGWGLGSGYEEGQPLANASGHRAWNGTPASPDPAFFDVVDHLLQVAEDLGLVLALLPTWGYYVVDTHLFDAENAFTYGEFLGNRYKDCPNVIWVSGGDRVPTGGEDAYRALARGLRAGDGGAHLITYHPCGWHSSSQFWHAEDWLDFNMIETWTDWDKVYPAVAADTYLTPVKPVVLGEGAYENGPEYLTGPITPLICRRQAWWALMAGGFYTTGQDQMWRMSPGWEKTFDTPGAAQMTILRQIIERVPWWRRIPDQGIFNSGVSSERTLNAAVRAEDSSWALLYLSSQCHVRVNINKVWAHDVKCTWINPATGAEKDAGIHETGNLGKTQVPQPRPVWFSVPWHWEDAMLLIEGIV